MARINRATPRSFAGGAVKCTASRLAFAGPDGLQTDSSGRPAVAAERGASDGTHGHARQQFPTARRRRTHDPPPLREPPVRCSRS
jgi:hypothetical protein